LLLVVQFIKIYTKNHAISTFKTFNIYGVNFARKIPDDLKMQNTKKIFMLFL